VQDAQQEREGFGVVFGEVEGEFLVGGGGGGGGGGFVRGEVGGLAEGAGEHGFEDGGGDAEDLRGGGDEDFYVGFGFSLGGFVGGGDVIFVGWRGLGFIFLFGGVGGLWFGLWLLLAEREADIAVAADDDFSHGAAD